jgi:hypothetical protein
MLSSRRRTPLEQLQKLCLTRTLVVPRVPMSRSTLGVYHLDVSRSETALGISPSQPNAKERHEWMLYENDRMWLPSQAA